jgi:hypothetical protein
LDELLGLGIAGVLGSSWCLQEVLVGGAGLPLLSQFLLQDGLFIPAIREVRIKANGLPEALDPDTWIHGLSHGQSQQVPALHMTRIEFDDSLQDGNGLLVLPLASTLGGMGQEQREVLGLLQGGKGRESFGRGKAHDPKADCLVWKEVLERMQDRFNKTLCAGTPGLGADQ